MQLGINVIKRGVQDILQNSHLWHPSPRRPGDGAFKVVRAGMRWGAGGSGKDGPSGTCDSLAQRILSRESGDARAAPVPDSRTHGACIGLVHSFMGLSKHQSNRLK